MSEIIKIITSEQIFLSDFEKCEYLDESIYHNEFKGMSKYQPNLLYLFVGVNQSDGLDKAEKDKIMRFFLTIWMLVKDKSNMTSQIVNMDAVDKEFETNYSYFKNINKIKDSKKLYEFMNVAFQNSRQKELYSIIFNIFLVENRKEKSITSKDLTMICYVKSYIDVIDKILHNDYFGTSYIVK